MDGIEELVRKYDLDQEIETGLRSVIAEELRSAPTQEQFFELSLDMICIAGKDGYFKKVSRSFTDILGYSEDELLSRSIEDFVLPEDRARTKEALAEASEGDVIFFRNRYKCKDGTVRWLSWHSVTVPEKDQIFAIARDITDVIQNELLLSQYVEEHRQSKKYAQHLQKAILFTDITAGDNFPEYFIFNRPKEELGGDFFWFGTKNDHRYIGALDCTGHGIAGALLTTLGSQILDQVLRKNKKKEKPPSRLLQGLHEQIKEVLTSSSSNTFDGGMDGGIVAVPRSRNELLFSGAKNPLYLIRDGKLTEYRGSRTSIGADPSGQEFKDDRISIRSGDVFYMFSDGYPDQFGGPKNKKFGYPRLRELLVDIHKEPLPEQKKLLRKTFDEWKGDQDQIDDVLVLGFRF